MPSAKSATPLDAAAAARAADAALLKAEQSAHVASIAAAVAQAAQWEATICVGSCPHRGHGKLSPGIDYVDRFTAVRPLQAFSPQQLEWLRHRVANEHVTIGGQVPVKDVKDLIALNGYTSRILAFDRNMFLRSQSQYYLQRAALHAAVPLSSATHTSSMAFTRPPAASNLRDSATKSASKPRRRRRKPTSASNKKQPGSTKPKTTMSRKAPRAKGPRRKSPFKRQSIVSPMIAQMRKASTHLKQPAQKRDRTPPPTKSKPRARSKRPRATTVSFCRHIKFCL